MYRRIAVLASLAVVGAMFVGSTTANAAVGDAAGACVFTGLAGNLTDDVNGAEGIDSIRDDISDIATNPLTVADIEHGTYDYSGPAFCAGKFGTATILPNADGSPNANISSKGEYHNVLCGTGYASDATGDETTITSGTTVVEDVGYEIPFVAGNGPLHIGTGLDSTNPFDEAGTQITGAYAGTGAVHITPDDDLDLNDGGDNCATVDTNEFQVAGAFVAASK